MKKTLRPYLFIAIAGLLAFAPVSFMLAALKNDIVALEYPINYFISQSIHNFEMPYWFNTWGMGFPLQSSLTWGIYSTPQLLICTIFNYNIYVLHLEFMFFILLSGWSMFYLLKKFFLQDETLALVLAVCYMLSGFMVGSSQWLLYITAAAFIPLVIIALLRLLQAPSFRHSMLFAVMYCLMFTSVYAAFNIITTYSLVIFLLIHLLTLKKTKAEKKRLVGYCLLAGLFTILLCFPSLYYTLELLPYMERGNSIADTAFFNSNYVHPAALSNMLFPFSSVKMNFDGTEGTMLHSYMGLFTLLVLPIVTVQTIQQKNRTAIILLAATLLFLLFSFGAVTPLRSALNILPGFSYFRNPGLFRLFFILSLIISTAIVFRTIKWNDLLTTIRSERIGKLTFLFLSVICLVVLLVNTQALKNLSFSSLNEVLKNSSFEQVLFFSALIQLLILGLLFLLIIKKRFRLASIILIGDLVVNTLICTPYFTVGSYSLTEINTILASEKGFPVQTKKVNEAAAVFTDARMNTWFNINVFRKEVSSNDTYRGPVTLKQFSAHVADTTRSQSLFDHPVVFAEGDTGQNKITLVLQQPTHIRATVDISKETTITAMQNYFPGWKVYYNGQSVELINKEKPGLTVAVPKGMGTVDFRYEKKGVWMSALFLHLLLLSFFIWQGYLFLKRKINTP